MWFNSKQRAEPYQLLTSCARYGDVVFPSGTQRQVLHGCRQLVSGLPVISREEGGDDVKSSWPLRAGLHTCYNGGDSGQRRGDPELISKSHLSSDCTLQLECMKLESLVIADQNAAVNTFPALYTPPVTPWELVLPEGAALTARGQATTVGSATGVKS
ncbi:hypothetical protein Lal_00001514 [Lupinus albus]|nr:hypothetical protein Lal_00001514 [Lupinus albus]